MESEGSLDRVRERDVKRDVTRKLLETGEMEKLKDLLRSRLVECGWRDQMKAHCKDVIREKGVENVKIDDLVKEITPKGRELVPDSVKKDLLEKIRGIIK